MMSISVDLKCGLPKTHPQTKKIIGGFFVDKTENILAFKILQVLKIYVVE